MTRRASVHRVAMRHPGDVAAIEVLFDAGVPDPRDVVAILGKTEGNGCVNDFTRAFAVQSLTRMLATRLGTTAAEVAHRVAMVMSGGTEGGLSPHFLVFSVSRTDAATNPAGTLAVATAFTRDFAPEEIGRMPQVEATAEAIAAAAASMAEIHYVQIKCPLLTTERIAEALSAARRLPPMTPTPRWASRAAPPRSASRWRWGRLRAMPSPTPRSAATPASIPAAPAPRPASS
jgi:cyanuric acid amidohydrolase